MISRKCILCFLLISVTIGGAIHFLNTYSIAAGRTGSHLVGGVGSSHKGGHYVGGTSPGSSSTYSGDSSGTYTGGSDGISSGGSSSSHFGGFSGTYSGGSNLYSRASSIRRVRSYRLRSSIYIRPSRYNRTHIWHAGIRRDKDGRIIRSESAKNNFLRSLGMKRIPPGMQIDHIIPLFAGGSDSPSNMQLISKAEHHKKTKSDFLRYRGHRRKR